MAEKQQITRRKPVKRKRSEEAKPARAEKRSTERRPETEPDGRSERAEKRAKRRAAAREKKHSGKRPWGKIIGFTLLAVFLVAVGLFAWNRWFRFDDAADIQGDWKVPAKNYTMVIDGTQMKLTEDVSYNYTIDTWAKTITYSFGSSSGHASYRFSQDRSVLVIEENAGTDWLVALRLKADPVIDEGIVGTGTSELLKVSSDTTASPQSLVNNSTSEANAAGTALDASSQSTSSDSGAASDTAASSSASATTGAAQ